jgi:hypothetical protein
VGEDRQDATGPPSTERVSVPQAADHLGTTVDAIRKRVQRRTIPHERDRDGRVWILLDTGRPRQDAVQDTAKPQSDSAALISEMRAHNATLQAQLEAERQAHAEARRLLMAALERIPPQLEEARSPSDGDFESVHEQRSPQPADPQVGFPRHLTTFYLAFSGASVLAIAGIVATILSVFSGDQWVAIISAGFGVVGSIAATLLGVYLTRGGR